MIVQRRYSGQTVRVGKMIRSNACGHHDINGSHDRCTPASVPPTLYRQCCQCLVLYWKSTMIVLSFTTSVHMETKARCKKCLQYMKLQSNTETKWISHRPNVHECPFRHHAFVFRFETKMQWGRVRELIFDVSVHIAEEGLAFLKCSIAFLVRSGGTWWPTHVYFCCPHLPRPGKMPRSSCICRESGCNSFWA